MKNLEINELKEISGGGDGHLTAYGVAVGLAVFGGPVGIVAGGAIAYFTTGALLLSSMGSK